MDSNPTALLALRRNLDAFIRADPVTLVLQRPNKIQTSAGGVITSDPAPLPPQQFRLAPFKRRQSNDIQNTQDGYLRLGEYVLVGRHNADVEKGDTFEYNNLIYRVREVEPRTDQRATTDRVSAALEVRDA